MKNFLISVAVLVCAVSGASSAHAQNASSTGASGNLMYDKAVVVAVMGSSTREIPGTLTPESYQTIEVKLLDGPDAGSLVTIDNDFLQLKPGDVFYALHNVDPTNHIDAYTVAEPYRLPTLGFLAALFLVLLIIFGGKQGLRGLLSLAASLFFISYLLLPGILAGFPPVVVSLGVSGLIIVLGSYLTHGFNRTTSAAVIGMLATILITGLLGWWVVNAGQFSGYTSEEVSYLNFNTEGTINLVGLLLGSLLIGLLGVLYDASISQAIAVEELLRAAAHYTRRQTVLRALRIGREHIGAVVNTLAIAYVGASLPLLLLWRTSTQQSLPVVINQELFASEIVRIMIGSIGVILAVPVTTFVAAYMLSGLPRKAQAPEEASAVHRH